MEFSKQVIVTLAVEAVLVLITLILMTEPGWILRPRGPSFRSALRVGGVLFLCLTFCWSFILGCMIAVQRISYRV